MSKKTPDVRVRRTSLAVCLLAGLLLLLSACGDATSTPATNPATSAAATTSAAMTTSSATATTSAAMTTSSATTETTGAVGQPYNLVIWADPNVVAPMTSDPNGKGRYGLFLKQQFEKEHPGVSVKIEDHGWDDELRQNLLTALMAGTGPDIVVGENFFQQYADLGALVPLDDVISDVKTNLIPGTYKAATVNNKVYGLSASTGTFGFERNCKVVEAAGLDCNNVPKTWDDLLAETTTINQKGAGKYYGYTLQGPAGYSLGSAFRIAVYLNQVDAPLTKEDGITPSFNNPKAVPVYEFLRKLNKNTPPGLTFNPDEGQVYTELFKGTSAFQIAGSWHVSWSKENGCADCRYSPVPVGPGGHATSMIVGNAIYAVLKSSKHPDMAAQWVKFVTRDDVQDMVYPLTQKLPSTRSALTKLKASADTSTQSFIDVMLNSSDLAVLPQWRQNPQQFWTVYNDMLTKVLTTNTPIQQILDEGQANAMKLVAKK